MAFYAKRKRRASKKTIAIAWNVCYTYSVTDSAKFDPEAENQTVGDNIIWKSEYV